jgi:hypothetical protein
MEDSKFRRKLNAVDKERNQRIKKEKEKKEEGKNREIIFK